MMQALLDIISEERLATPTLLARRLDVSPALVGLMFADLERAGYLRALADDGTRCAGRGLRPTCKTPEPLWVRTGK